MYKQYLVLGDWSGDGHSRSEKILLECNYPVKEVQQAYKDSCKLTGISFNINDDYTGRNLKDFRDWRENEKYQIATGYQSPFIPKEAWEILKRFNIEDFLQDYYGNLEEILKYAYTEEGFEIEETEMFVQIWIWFVKLSLPEDCIFYIDRNQDTIPVINGYWNENLNVQFGYGLYQ